MFFWWGVKFMSWEMEKLGVAGKSVAYWKPFQSTGTGYKHRPGATRADGKVGQAESLMLEEGEEEEEHNIVNRLVVG